MHFNHILLVRAKDKKDAVTQIRKFLEPYNSDRKDNDPEHLPVWDWYQIGGRWAWAWQTEEGKKKRAEIADKNGFYRKDTDSVNIDYRFKDQIDKNPENTEVLCCADDDSLFFDTIKKSQDMIMQNLGRLMIYAHEEKAKCVEELEGKRARGMLRYLRKKIKYILDDKYNSESFFYDTEKMYHFFPYSQDHNRYKEIVTHAKEYFLVNVDLHN